MMATLRVVVDQILTDSRRGVERYSEELIRQLIATAPEGCGVAAIVAARSKESFDEVGKLLPGLVSMQRIPLHYQEIAKAFPVGLKIPSVEGMVHAPSLLAPLRGHSRQNGEQVAVTIHNAIPWTDPGSLKQSDVTWNKMMAKRARKFADAVVVPTHAVADQLSEFLDFGDRIRVIGGAPATSLQLPDNADERAAALGLPDKYVLGMGSPDPRKALGTLLAAMALPTAPDLPLVIVGLAEHGEQAVAEAAAAGLASGRVHAVGDLSNADLAVVYDRATVFAFPSLSEGFGLPLIEAFRFATPVVHSDDPALVEVAGGAGLVVPREDAAGYADRLAEAIASVVSDATLAERLGVSGSDRARVFSWRDSAERVWQLHADL